MVGQGGVVSDPRAVNARLRLVVAGKDELILSLEEMVRAQAGQLAGRPS